MISYDVPDEISAQPPAIPPAKHDALGHVVHAPSVGWRHLTESHVTDILASVDAGFAEQVAFTEALVCEPSLRGHEAGAQALLADAYAARGYQVDRFTLDVEAIKHHPGFSPACGSHADMTNVVATHDPGTSGRSLILNGHVDVVPTGPEDMWSFPPFSAWSDEHWCYGRGVADMKAGLVANLFALDALRRLGLEPAGRVHLQSVVEEECTGNGALSCLVRGYNADAAIITEPLFESLARSHLGVIWFRLHVRGRPEHAAQAYKGFNAIAAAWKLVEALKGLEGAWNAQRFRHPHYAHMAHPINFNVGRIAGGDWASSVPSWCTVDMRAGVYPDVDPRDAAREIEACIHDACLRDDYMAHNPATVEYNGFFARGADLPEGTDAEATLACAHQAAAGRALTASPILSYLDARVFLLYGNTPCLVYGPYGEGIHAFDERVSLASLKRVTGSIALFAADWCGLQPRTP